MAFRASNSLPDVGLDRAKKLALQLKEYLQQRNVQLQSTTGADVITAIMSDLRAYRVEFQLIAAIPGIAAHARDLENDQNYDVVAEFNTMVAAIAATITEIVNTFPKDASAYWLAYQVAGDGTTIFRTFPPAALAQLRTRITAVIASIS